MTVSHFDREHHLQQAIHDDRPFDLVIIGGGASGVGTALDAAARKLRVLLLESADFGKGTSSRSTKLIHGGVRYLQQGNVGLVRESLRERALLLNNAAHLVHPLEFLLPCRSWKEVAYYAIGMKAYDLLGRGGARPGAFPRSRRVAKDDLYTKLPELNRQAFVGGISYCDGQFDDSRLLINLVQTAAEQGALLVNRAQVVSLIKNSGRAEGVEFIDQETGALHRAFGRCIINATGPFCDAIRRLDLPQVPPMIAASQGIHLVLPKHFYQSSSAMIVPKTRDGRVMFIIPWHDHVLLGTTDTPISSIDTEPTPLPSEMAFLLETAAEYLSHAPTIEDCLSVFTGIRPLVVGKQGMTTKALSRDHTLEVSSSQLLTMTGGKWTTYRQMSEDCVDRALQVIGIPNRPSITKQLPIHGLCQEAQQGNGVASWNDGYGADRMAIETLIQQEPELQDRIHPASPIRRAEVVWGVRHEWARTVEDILARRTRVLFLNASIAREMAKEVAKWMAMELKRDSAWEEEQVIDFEKTAAKYIPFESKS